MIIRVVRIGFEGRHGTTAAERRSAQRFEVDVEIEADVSAAGRSDRIGDTIDYREVADIVVGIGSGESRRLLEALATTMLDALTTRFPQGRVALEVRKLNPQGVPGHPAWTSVRTEGRRASAPAQAPRSSALSRRSR